MLGRHFFLTVVLTTLATVVVGIDGPGGNEQPARRSPTREGYADIFPEGLQEDIFGNFEFCLNLVQRTVDNELPNGNLEDRRIRASELIEQCAQERDSMIAAWMNEIAAGRPPRENMLEDPDPNPGPSQFTLDNFLQSVGGNMMRSLRGGNNRPPPRASPGRFRPLVPGR